MALNMITVGDATTHGGRVISGSPLHNLRDKPIARLGDLVDCPQHYPGGRPHGVNKIIEGCATFTVGGIPAALEGHHTECGCALIGSQPADVG